MFTTETKRMTKKAAAGLAVLLLAGAMAGCGKKQGGPAGGAPVTEVGVVELKGSEVTLTQELPGRTSAYRAAEVRARASGVILKRMFTEGGEVKEGQQLYEIDPAPYVAALKSAEATLARTKANLSSAKLQSERFAELVKTKAVSQQNYDNAVAATAGFEADQAAAEAALLNAQINLDYTKVFSPISGRIGKSSVTEGAYVQAAAATLLATVQQIDPMYVDVVQPVSEVQRLKREVASGRLKVDDSGRAKMTLFFDDGRKYADEGSLEFSDISVSTSTSSLLIRAVFPNKKGELLPGMFVRGLLTEGVQTDAVLAPMQGVSRNSKGEPTALVAIEKTRAEDTKVGKPGEKYFAVELRILELDRTVGDTWLVKSGLKIGEQLIVENLQRIRPGMEIHVKAAALAEKK